LFAGALWKMMLFAELKHLIHRFFVTKAGDVMEGLAAFGFELRGVRVKEIQGDDLPGDLFE